MAGLEQQLFASGLPVEALMEKAALAISRRLLERHRPELERQGALVLVGPGHNGGDGLVVARELHLAGLAVRIWCPFERLKPLTETHLRHALWLGIPRLAEPPDPGEAPIWIDALLGINQSRAAGERLEGLLAERQRRQPNRLVAIDVPTGLCADTGRLTGAVAARAGCTYTVGLLKTGLIQDRALAWVGELERLELGLPAALLNALPHSQPLGLGTADLARAPWPQADREAGKYERGRLLLVAGSERYRGAAHLALAGARASGCGSVRAALPAALAEQLWQLFPEVVLAGSPGETEGELSPLAQLTSQHLERVDGLLVGPGLGAGRDAAGGPDIWELLQGFPGLLVLDADGLNQLALTQAGRQECGVHRWLQGRGGATWLTPHAAEFQRLFPELAAAPLWRLPPPPPWPAERPCYSRAPAAWWLPQMAAAGNCWMRNPGWHVPASGTCWRAMPPAWGRRAWPQMARWIQACWPWRPWPTPRPAARRPTRATAAPVPWHSG